MISVHALPASSIEALAPSVRIIGRAGIGLDAIDLEAARARGVAVFHTPDYCTMEVADHAAAMILALARRLFPADAIARRDWPAWRSIGEIRALSDSTLGVVGCGRIGREVIRRMAPFGMTDRRLRSVDQPRRLHLPRWSVPSTRSSRRPTS